MAKLTFRRCPPFMSILYHALGLFGLWALMGCNLFRETLGLSPETAEAHIVEGHLRLQKADYAGALQEYEAALALDSAKSEAYYGAAKTSLLLRRINMFRLLQTFQENDPGKVPFLSEPDSIKDQIYTANRAINSFLKPMIRRDSLGLLDGKISVGSIAADYALATAIEAVLSLADFNGDGRIDSKDNILNGIIDFSDPTKLNPDSLMRNLADLKNDTAKITALNILLDKTQDLLTESGSAIDLFLNAALDKGDSALGGVQCAEADSACIKAQGTLAGTGRDQVGDSAISQVKDFLQNAGASVVIYKVFDRLDNDGDGCIDEELLDGLDNDGDGYADEDSRGAPDTLENTRFYADADGADNDLKDGVDNGDEADFHQRYLASLQPLALLTHADRRARIFWNGDTDTRIKKAIFADSLSNPALVDSVSTFDLCRGQVTGYKYRKTTP